MLGLWDAVLRQRGDHEKHSTDYYQREYFVNDCVFHVLLLSNLIMLAFVRVPYGNSDSVVALTYISDQ